MSGSSFVNVFEVLGIDRPAQANRKSVRAAYAKRLKEIDPATDPQAFQDLRSAFEAALDIIDRQGAGTPVITSARQVPADPSGRESKSENGPETGDGQGEMPPAPVTVTAAELSLAELQCLRPGQNGVSKITRILNEDGFEDLELNSRLERELVRFLDRSLVMHPSGVPGFTSEITPGLLKAMAFRFDWLSDYRGIEKNAARPELVSMAISFMIGAEQTRQEHERASMALWDKVIAVAVFVGIPVGVAAQFLEKDSIWQLLAGGAAGLSFLAIMFVLMRR